MEEVRQIYCCGCQKNVAARLTGGQEIYPHRKDLYSLPFWKCDSCKNFVGCHHKTKNRTRPLGVIPTPEIKKARSHIHRILDPLWKSGRFKRKDIYAKLSKHINQEYHTAEIRDIDTARSVYSFIKKITNEDSR
jgi:hypothetical protein